MTNEAPDNAAILAAINSLDEKVEKRLDELVQVDKRLTEEVGRIGRRQEQTERDLSDLKSDTLRRFDAERAESKSTMEAIVTHVDKSAEAFRMKAKDIDELKAMQVQQTAILERLDKVAANPIVRKVAYGLAMVVLAWLASKGVR